MLPRHGEAHVRTKSGQTCPCGKPSVRLSWFHHCEPFTKRKKAYAMPYRYFLMGLCWVVLVVLAIPMQAQSSCENPLQDAEWSSSWELTDFCQFQAGVFDEIDVIIPRDAIRPIDAPTFDSLLVADGWLAPQSPVIALEYMGEARAYPLAIMTKHEIVNDNIAGVPIAVTYCPLCNSAIVFVRDVDGVTLRFGTTGMLRKSDLIMWDDVTESWWQQFTGEGIVGTYTGELLEIVPSLLVGYGAFKARYPDGVVLSQGDYIYGRQNYFEYDSQERPFAFNEALDTRLPATERVLAYFTDDDAMAYPFSVLEATPIINDRIGGRDVVAFWQAGKFSATDQGIIDLSRDVGMAALYERTLEDGTTLIFERDEVGIIRDTQTGTVWNFFGQAEEGALAGTQLRQLNAFPHFWFAWVAFRPETRIYGQDYLP
jgi:hypothetical protein